MQNEVVQMADEEIRLKDILGFIKLNWRLILSWILAGVLISAAYVLLSTKKYEARWQMQMAQLVNNRNSNSSINLNNVEEPVTLIQRLREQIIYPVEVRQSCVVPEGEEFNDYMGSALKVVTIKNVVNKVELKLSALSPEQANKCAEAIIAMIIAQQRSLIDERFIGRKEQLQQYQQAFREELKQLETMKKSELSNISYLSKLDKLSWLRTRIDTLQEEAFLSQMHPAKLVGSIYVPSSPASRKVSSVLLLGVTLGLMFGVLYALGREKWRKAARGML